MNCLTWRTIAYLEPSRALLDAGLTNIVHEVDSLDIQVSEDVPSPPILGCICKIYIFIIYNLNIEQNKYSKSSI